MRQSIRLGRVAGVPVGVHWSVAVIFGLVTWQLATIVFPDAYGTGDRPEYWGAAVAAAVLFFLSLLAHEASHALVARRNGVGVQSITLWLFGGVAQLDGEARTPGADFRIAIVGPGTSVVLAGVFASAQLLLERAGAHGLVVDVATWLWEINLLLAVFNLIPAAPLDGGRVLRAGIWRVSHDHTRASVLAARAGLGFGIVLMGLGIVEFAMGAAVGLWPAFLGWFLFMAARAEETAAKERGGIEGASVGSVMIPHPPVVPAGTTVAELVAVHLPWWHGTAAAVVGPTGWLAGVVTLAQVNAVAPDRRTTTTVGDIAVPIGAAPVGRPDEPMPDLLGRMYASGGRPAVVLDPDNRLAGIVTLDDVVRAGRRQHQGAGRV
ncbi:MAG TPA: site-2 protease family protein [Acidimicrobiales bacterium]|nr:site-2 protease family protein [Acidimicrobiales bacterium]